MKKKRNHTARQEGYIYNIEDLQLTLLDLNDQGYDLHVSTDDSMRLQVTCKKTNNRFLIEQVRDNDWPT